MLKFCLTTTSESGDDYIYFIEHHKKPTNKEIQKWLLINGNDIDEDTCYENVNQLVEIKEFEKLSK